MKTLKHIRKVILFLYLLLIIGVLVGCNTAKPNVNLSDVQNNDPNINLQVQDLDIDSFINLQESIIENDLKVEKVHDGDTISLKVDGKYDLNGDKKKDKIQIRVTGREDSTIRINKSEISIYCDHPYDFYLVDFIKDDGFVEIAVYDDGPSADPITTFYRYDGKNIYELGSFHTDINVGDSIQSYYGNVLTDGKGKFISPGNIVKFISPEIIKGYYSIEDNKFKYSFIDNAKYLNKEYALTEELEAFFIEQNISKDLRTEDIQFIWDVEDMIQFKKGEKIKIITYDDFWYGVELQDGSTGILYFWIGD